VRMRIRAITEYDGTGRAIEEPLWVESTNWQGSPQALGRGSDVAQGMFRPAAKLEKWRA